MTRPKYRPKCRGAQDINISKQWEKLISLLSFLIFSRNQDISDIFNQVEERERRELGPGESPGEGPKWAQAAEKPRSRQKRRYLKSRN